ncbi:hypothetical protein IT570_12590 [Candidatus Sumerlaeota bacterium]|nr:hypothetical protein [Candidatus Sumerlaeota bacterium]
MRAIAIVATVPENTGTVFITGNLPELGNWDPGKVSMEGTGTTRTKTLKVPDGTKIEFKFTLGSWEREAMSRSGAVSPNNILVVEADQQSVTDIPGFRMKTTDYVKDWRGSGVLGRLDYYPDMKSKFLERPHTVAIWLPPGYDESPGRRYQVLYMHDGQNLFDPRQSFTGLDWGVDECIVRLVEQGRIDPLIVVSTSYTDKRFEEYDPWTKGPQFADFLIKEVMPMVNEKYRTLTGPENTGAMGASMGGLISFYLGQKHSDVFGKVGCLSTHWPWSGEVATKPTRPALIDSMLADPAAKFPASVRAYFDHGTEGIDAAYEPYQRKVTAWLKAQGLEENKNFVVRKFNGANHSEKDWRERLDVPMLFLFAKPE